MLTSLVLSSGLAFSYLVAYGQHELAALHPPLLYCALLGLLLFPGALLFRDTRLFFGQTLWRVATPLRAVTWADFLLADVLTSLAKALSDTERAVCHLMIGPVMQPHLKVGWRLLRGAGQPRACSLKHLGQGPAPPPAAPCLLWLLAGSRRCQPSLPPPASRRLPCLP